MNSVRSSAHFYCLIQQMIIKIRKVCDINIDQKWRWNHCTVKCFNLDLKHPVCSIWWIAYKIITRNANPYWIGCANKTYLQQMRHFRVKRNVSLTNTFSIFNVYHVVFWILYYRRQIDDGVIHQLIFPVISYIVHPHNDLAFPSHCCEARRLKR